MTETIEAPPTTLAPEPDISENGKVPADTDLTVRRLELHGYKTFASPTDFEFDDGITAIVGPNGSGKSNITDAIRWVLGEQRISVLRAKTNEDMIFNGTAQRARMGMAQVFLTLDNSDRSLPVDFSEVEIGRRTYRSGENEYLLNGNKVRLRDIQELLAHVGVGTNSYTVIGQGLVDAALSLRASERREIIENAAGLGAYQGKRSDAMRRLEETEENLHRVQDLIAEIKPRLGRLERQAERADEYNQLTDQLQELLRQWYGYQWEQANQALYHAHEQVETTTKAAGAAHRAVETAEQQLADSREEEAKLRDRIETLRRERSKLRSDSERLRRERAVAQERASLLTRQAEELEEELAELTQEAERLDERGETLASERRRLESQRTETQQHLESVQERLRTAENKREDIRSDLEVARREQARINARAAELQQEQNQLSERKEELEQERSEHRAALSDIDAKLTRHAGEIQLYEDERETLRRQRAELVEEQHELRDVLSAARDNREQCETTLNEIERELGALESRRELLSRLRAEGSGYEEGVRSLLQAAQNGTLDGIIAPLVDTLRAPEHLNTAISAALNTELQTIIVEDLRAADQARQWLQGREIGRVTLLPRSDRRGDMPLPPAPDGTGIVGRAAELVPADDPIILEHALGRWLIVEDWNTAVDIAKDYDEWHVVTLDGEVVRRDGSVQAGKGDGGGRNLLAQSREWAELPRNIETAERQRDNTEEALLQAEDAVEILEDELESLTREIDEVDRQIERAETRLAQEQREAERLEQEQEWRSELVERLHNDLTDLSVRADELREEREALASARDEAKEHVAALEDAFEQAHPGSLREAVEKARTGVAVVDEQRAGLKRQENEWRAAQRRLQSQRTAKTTRAEELADEQEQLQAKRARISDEADELDATITALTEKINPLSTRISELESEQAAQEEKLVTLRRQAQEADEAVHRAQMSRQAAEDRLDHLHDQIESDLGLVEFGELEENLPHQSFLPIEEYVTTLPQVSVLPDGVENDIKRLRRMIGRLGSVNPDAPEEYEEVQERYEFLTSQVTDLQEAEADLREIVDQLDHLMEQRFVETLTSVDAAFQRYFARLFGGGTATLELDDDTEPLESGIEITARPPGKRPQNIALLSGGERALTAASLIFAILSVSPAPFCVMDEVDAMLDEANVGRFCDTLRELSHDTQFIIITHNRGTIEAADTIYGISQTESGVSSMLSLAVEEAVRAAKQ